MTSNTNNNPDNYQLVQSLGDVPLRIYPGTMQDAINMFESEFPDFQTNPRYYMTKNGQKITPKV